MGKNKLGYNCSLERRIIEVEIQKEVKTQLPVLYCMNALKTVIGLFNSKNFNYKQNKCKKKKIQSRSMYSSDYILTPHLNPTSQSLLPSSLKQKLYTSLKNLHRQTHIIVNYFSPSCILQKIQTGNSFVLHNLCLNSDHSLIFAYELAASSDVSILFHAIVQTYIQCIPLMVGLCMIV